MTALQLIDHLLTKLIERTINDTEYIETTIIYMKDTGKRYVIDMARGNTVCEPIGIFTKIQNGRTINCTLKTNGFQLLSQRTALSTMEFYQNAQDLIQSLYYKEIETLIQKLTGAPIVRAFEHQIRCSSDSAPESATESVGAAAHGAHCDFTLFSALRVYESMLLSLPNQGMDYKRGRFAVINVWRNISDSEPIRNYHLAVMDGQSVVAPDDFIKYDFIPNDSNRIESYYLNAARASNHKWFYFPEMMKDEVLVFMQYDSDYQSSVRYTFHTAIYDPTYEIVRYTFPDTIRI